MRSVETARYDLPCDWPRCGLALRRAFFCRTNAELASPGPQQFAPGKDYWRSSNPFRFTILGFRPDISASSVDPASLTELGKLYQRKAIRNERVMFAWMAGGFILVVWASSYFKMS